MHAELAAHWRDNVLDVSTVTEEQPLQELLLPRNAASRLCFFSLPLHRLPFYRDRVFPAVAELGFVPVTSDDVVSPGSNISAKIDALMDRATVIVVEIGSPGTIAELGMALSLLRGTDLERARRPALVVIGPEDALPSKIADFSGVMFSRIDDQGDADLLVSRLVAVLSGLAPAQERRQAEPQRLLDAKEYRAAVISAMSYLEQVLRERLSKPEWRSVSRPMSLRNLIDRAVAEGELSAVSLGQIIEWMRIRNEAVHSNSPVTRQQAQQIVTGVMTMLQR